MKKQLSKIVLTLIATIIMLAGVMPAYANNQYATAQYVELWRLSKGEAGIVLELYAGLEPNSDKLTATGEYYDGAEIFHHTDKNNENLMLFFENNADGDRFFSGMAAVTGDFLGIRIGIDSIEVIADFLGAPDVYEESADMMALPMVVYCFPEGTLRLYTDINYIITEADYKVEDNTKRLAIKDALTPSVYKNAKTLNVPRLRELSTTGIIPPRAWYDFKWPVSRDGIAYICVELYEFLTKEKLKEADPSPYADETSSHALKAVTLGIFDDLPGEQGVLKPYIKLSNEEVCNLLNVTLKAANINYTVVSPLGLKDLVSYEDALIMVYNALKSEEANEFTVNKTVKIYYPNYQSNSLVGVTKEITISPSLLLDNRTDYKVLEAMLKQNGGEAYWNVLEKETVINGISLDKESDLLRFDVSSDILTYNVGVSAEGLILNSLALTFMEFYDATQFLITVDGRLYESGHAIFEPGEYISLKKIMGMTH